MKALVVSLESFQKGEVPEEVKKFPLSCEKKPFIVLYESSNKMNEKAEVDLCRAEKLIMN